MTHSGSLVCAVYVDIKYVVLYVDVEKSNFLIVKRKMYNVSYNCACSNHLVQASGCHSYRFKPTTCYHFHLTTLYDEELSVYRSNRPHY